jgi:CBS domain-containing protein
MTLRDILAVKGDAVFTITPAATAREAAKKLMKCQVGALLVMEEEEQRDAGKILGIISERDLLRSFAEEGFALDKLRVAEVMSTPLVTVSPDELVGDVMGVMTRERKRHLPVVADGRLLGVVSIGDVVKSQHDHLVMENRFMKDYIGG